MCANVRQWKRIRDRVLIRGESLRSVALAEGMSRNTLRRMVRFELPPGFRRAGDLGQQPVVLT